VPVRRFRAFAFFFEALEDLVTFSAAVLFADSELCRQAEVFRLLFGLPSRSSFSILERAKAGTDADVDNRANHGSQISAVVLHGQVKHAVQV
jgi:hypothetical protein